MLPENTESVVPKAFTDDPVWVLARYREAKEILTEMQALAALPDDLSDAVDEWLSAVLMDDCTTCGTDCACNFPRAANTEPVYALWEDVEQRVYAAVEGELTDYDPTEGPGPSRSEIEWAQKVAKRVQQATMMHLDGYQPKDIAP